MPRCPAQGVSRRVAILAALLSALFGRSPALAQSTLQGVVREDSTGGAISGADVWIEALRAHAHTDSLGRFRIVRVPAGVVQIQARHIGYYPAGAVVRLADGEVRDVELALSRVATELPAVRVADRVPGSLGAGLEGFGERRRLGFGQFLDSTVLRQNEHKHLIDLLQRVPGIRTVAPMVCGRTCRPEPSRAVAVNARMGRGLCLLEVYLDGVLAYRGQSPGRIDWESTFDLNSVSVASLAAVEVYRGGAEAPGAYAGTGAGCGLLVLWTRRH